MAPLLSHCGEKASGQSLSFCICEIETRVDHFRYSGIKCDDLCEVISAVLTNGRCLTNDGSGPLMTIT